MEMNRYGRLTMYNQNDVNHCFSAFDVLAFNGKRVRAFGLLDALMVHAEFGGDAYIYAAGDVWTWDANAGADRRYYCAASRKVGFEPVEG